MKAKKITFWIVTGLLSAMMLMSASMYLFNYDEITVLFGTLGFPAWVIYPLATLKILGIVAILTRKVHWIKEWAYAGFFFNFLLALGAHLSAGDGEFPGAIMALVLLITSYILQKSAFPAKASA